MDHLYRAQKQGDGQDGANRDNEEAQEQLRHPVKHPGATKPPKDRACAEAKRLRPINLGREHEQPRARTRTTSGENTKIATAEAFMPAASALFVAPADRTGRPATVRAHNIRKPMPPPK